MKMPRTMLTAHTVLLIALTGAPALAEPVTMPPVREKTVLPSAVPDQPGQPAPSSTSPFAPVATPAVASPPAAMSRRSSGQGLLRGRLRSKLRGLFHRRDQ